MRSEGFWFSFGGLGVELCSLDVAMSLATVRSVRNSSSLGPYGSASEYRSSLKLPFLEGFERRQVMFGMAGMEHRDITPENYWV